MKRGKESHTLSIQSMISSLVTFADLGLSVRPSSGTECERSHKNSSP